MCGTVGVVAGSLQSGFNPLQSLSGTIVSAPRATELVYFSLLIYLIPIAAIVCIGLLLSTVTHNSAAAVVGTLMVSLVFQLLGILPGLGGLQPYLLSTQFNAWQGLLRTPIDWTPIIRAVWICAIYGFAVAVHRVSRVHPARRRRRVAAAMGDDRAATGAGVGAARVLVADDDPPLRRMLKRSLTADGFEVTVAADGPGGAAGGRALGAGRDRARRRDAGDRRAVGLPAAA